MSLGPSAQPARKPGGLIRVLTDDKWAGWLPIYAWVIDHPEGIIVVDTGDTDSINATFFLDDHAEFYTNNVQFTAGECNNTKLFNIHCLCLLNIDFLIQYLDRRTV